MGHRPFDGGLAVDRPSYLFLKVLRTVVLTLPERRTVILVLLVIRT